MSVPRSPNLSPSVVSVSELGEALKELANLEATLSRCSQTLTTERFRSGDTCCASEPGLGLLAVQSIAVIERGQDALPPLLTYLQDLMQRAERQKMRNSAFVSAIRRIPHELLAKIFILVAEEERLRHRGQLARYSFARVCHRWRAVAHSTTELWTSVFVWTAETTSLHGLFAKELMFSGERLLDVHLTSDPLQDLRLIRSTKSWELIQKQSYRWQTLSLDVGFFIFAAMTPKPITCPSLQAVRLKHDRMHVHEPERGLFLELSCAPTLRSVDIRIDQFLGRTSTIRFPETWSLTELRLSVGCCDGGVSRFLPILGQSSNTLERLCFSIQAIQRHVSLLNTSHVCMSKLTELTCRSQGTDIVSYIDAPALTSLTIRDHAAAQERRPPINLPSIRQRIRMYQSLAKLSLLDVDWPMASLMALLSNLPDLESLELEESHNTCFGKLITERLCESLTNAPRIDTDAITSVSAPCPLPRLSCLIVTMHCDAAPEKIINAIHRMGTSRIKGENGVKPLSSFACRYRNPGAKDLVNIHHWGTDEDSA